MAQCVTKVFNTSVPYKSVKRCASRSAKKIAPRLPSHVIFQLWTRKDVTMNLMKLFVAVPGASRKEE